MIAAPAPKIPTAIATDRTHGNLRARSPLATVFHFDIERHLVMLRHRTDTTNGRSHAFHGVTRILAGFGR
jgi:hypothetical protein